MNRKSPKTLIDSRHLKILAVKKEELKDSLVLVFVDEKKVGHYDMSVFREAAKALESLEPSADFVLATKEYNFQIFDKKELKNKDLIITSSEKNPKIEKSLMKLLGAKSIKFVYGSALQIDWHPAHDIGPAETE